MVMLYCMQLQGGIPSLCLCIQRPLLCPGCISFKLANLQQVQFQGFWVTLSAWTGFDTVSEAIWCSC